MSEVIPKEWADKTGIPYDELIAKFNDNLATLKKLHPTRPEQSLTMQARYMVYASIKSRMFTRAQPFDIIFLGYNAAMDVTRAQRELALQIWRTDREKAIREGWTDAEGNPLDNRPTVPEGLRGRRLVPTFLRQSIGIGRPAKGGELKLTITTHIGDQASNVPPIGKPVRCLLNLRSDEPYRYIANSSKFTKYEPVQMSEFPKVDEKVICDLLLKAPNDFRTTLADLHQWHLKHENDNRRICIVDANVIYQRPDPLPSGSYLLVIEDESMMDLEGEGVTVFVNGELKDMLDFGVGSRVIVLGRTTTGPGFNRETRQLDTSIVRTMINGFGVWAIPEFKIPKEESEVLVPAEDVSGVTQ